jgi:NADH-quinone oxidoreductase subunit L
VGGWRLAYRFYVQDPQKPEEWAQRWPTFYNLSVNKYFVDEGYAKGVVTPIYNLSVGLWRVCDDRVIDFIVNLVANMIAAISEAGRRVMQTGYVRTYALWMAIGALCVMWFIV